MYLACRHIRPGGVRCQSPALKGQAFCYFHARLHSSSKPGLIENGLLPVPEDSAAIQESLGRIFQAIVLSHIDPKQAGQLLWGLQIASSILPRKPQKDPRSVESLTHTKDGTELAPVFTVCQSGKDCKNCDKAATCERYFDLDEFLGRDKRRAAGTDHRSENKPANPKASDEESSGEDPDSGEDSDGDEALYASWDDDDEDDDDGDDDDEITAENFFETFQTFKNIEEALELDE